MNYLIVDLNIQLDGHKIGFVQETINWLTKNTNEMEHHFHFLINQPVQTYTSTNITVHNLDSGNKAKINRNEGIKKYNEQWDFIKLKVSELDVQKVILMELDIYQIAIGNDKISGFDISGIWFRPYFRQTNLSSFLLHNMLFNLKKWRKKIMFKHMLRNRNLKQVFVLNDMLTVNHLNEQLGQRLFYLPDPVFEYPEFEEINIREKYGIEDSRFVFLIFGHIDDRKNVANILRALRNLDKRSQDRIALLLVGKVAKHYEQNLIKLLDEQSDFQLVKNNEFVSDDEMESLFEQSDLVLRMNVNYFASSGIIGMAAKYNKPSLVSDYGIVAELTEEYKLGKTVDPSNYKAISSYLKNFLEDPMSWQINGQEYFQSHDTGAFVKTLLSLE